MGFESFAIVELMGHSKVAGKVIEETVFGTPMMRVDVPRVGSRAGYTKYYSAGSIYCFTPCDEATAQLAAESFDQPAISPYIVRLPESPALAAKVRDEIEESYYPDPYDFDEDDDYDDYGEDRDVDDDGYDDDEDEPEYFADGQPVDATQPDVAGYPSHKTVAAARAADLLTAPFVIFDTETTGFESSDEIIQISIIDQDGATVFTSYIKPVQPIRNSQYHGITDEIVKDAPTFPEVYEQIKAALHGKTVLAYNYEYDSKMLSQVCRRHDLEIIKPAQSECVMELYAQFYGEWNDYHGNYRWQKLNQAVARFGLAFDGKEHDSLADCKATLGVLKKMAEWRDPNPAPKEPEAST